MDKFDPRGNILKRMWSNLLLMPSWFAPHSKLRVLFHKLRGVKIGKDVEIGYFCILGNIHPQMVIIEDSAVISAGAVLLEHDYSHYYTIGGSVRKGPVLIKKKAFIGIYAVILPGVTIGEQSIVSANSLVVRNVPSNTVVGGIPAQFILKNE